MINVDIDFTPGLLTVAGDMFSLAGHLENPEEALRTAIETVVSPSIRMNFDVGGRPPWVPLMDTTLEHATNSYRTGGTLVLTGALRDVGSSMEVWNISDDSAQLDANLLGSQFYGAIHQVGYETAPAREWAVLQPEDLDKIEEVFDGWTSSALSDVGFISSTIGAVTSFFSRVRRRRS